MLPKSDVAGYPDHQKTSIAKAHPPPPPKAESGPAPLGKISAARAAVRQFLASELEAREIRITKIAPVDHGSDGWSAEAEILVPNLEVKMLGLPLTQEILQRERYSVELETDLSVRSYGYLGLYDD